MRPKASLAYLLSMGLLAGGCAQVAPLTMRVPEQGTLLRILPGAASPASQAAAQDLLRRLAIVDAEGHAQSLQAGPDGRIQFNVRPGMQIHLMEGSTVGAAVIAFERGNTLPVPAPEEMERGIAVDGGTFFVEHSSAAVGLRPTGSADAPLVEALPVAEAGDYTVYFAPGTAAGRYDKYSTQGAVRFLGVMQANDLGHEYVWGGFLFAMVVIAAIVATGIVLKWGKD